MTVVRLQMRGKFDDQIRGVFLQLLNGGKKKGPKLAKHLDVNLVFYRLERSGNAYKKVGKPIALIPGKVVDTKGKHPKIKLKTNPHGEVIPKMVKATATDFEVTLRFCKQSFSTWDGDPLDKSGYIRLPWIEHDAAFPLNNTDMKTYWLGGELQDQTGAAFADASLNDRAGIRYKVTGVNLQSTTKGDRLHRVDLPFYGMSYIHNSVNEYLLSEQAGDPVKTPQTVKFSSMKVHLHTSFTKTLLKGVWDKGEFDKALGRMLGTGGFKSVTTVVIGDGTMKKHFTKKSGAWKGKSSHKVPGGKKVIKKGSETKTLDFTGVTVREVTPAVPFFHYWVVYDPKATPPVAEASAGSETADRKTESWEDDGFKKTEDGTIRLVGKKADQKLIHTPIVCYAKLKTIVDSSAFQNASAEKQMTDIAETIAHEIGHCLGLSHVRNRTSPQSTASGGGALMAYGSDGQSFSGLARAIFKRHYGVTPPAPDLTLHFPKASP